MFTHVIKNIFILALSMALTGCRSYTNSTPCEYFEGDNTANYQRVFKEKVPSNVTVINSVVVGYQWSPGVVTTDDFEFELIVPKNWVEKWKKNLFLQDESTAEIQYRKDHPIRPWYAPKELKDYEVYRDRTSVGYVHLLVDRTREENDQFHVFYCKH